VRQELDRNWDQITLRDNSILCHYLKKIIFTRRNLDPTQFGIVLEDEHKKVLNRDDKVVAGQKLIMRLTSPSNELTSFKDEVGTGTQANTGSGAVPSVQADGYDLLLESLVYCSGQARMGSPALSLASKGLLQTDSAFASFNQSHPLWNLLTTSRF